MFFEYIPDCFDRGFFFSGFGTGIIKITVPFALVDYDHLWQDRVAQTGRLEVLDDPDDLHFGTSSASVLHDRIIPNTDFLADRVIDAHDASSFFIDDGFCPRGSPISIVCQIAVIDETAFQHRYVKNFREVAAYLQDLEVWIEIQRLTFPFDFVLCIRFMGDGKYSGLCESF